MFEKVTFWICFFILFYTYIGYALLSYLLLLLKKKNKEAIYDSFIPDVTILIAAYNEKDFIDRKLKNTFALDYPKNKIKYIIVTDGSDDGTDEIVKRYLNVIHLHSTTRQGKIAAIDRGLKFVKSPFVIFTDANSMVNSDAVRKLVRHFNDPRIGAVAGEKRIKNTNLGATDAGEGIYWKYESMLKKIDSELHTVVGAAGELYAIRTSLYQRVPKEIIIEDFYLTLRIAEKGYKVAYEPEAYSIESASVSIEEELKRKIRIAAGGLQSVVLLKNLLNPFKNSILFFQYLSHRVLRWTLAPLCLPIIYITNLILAIKLTPFYDLIFILQTLFYVSASLGFLFEKRKIKIKLFFIPFYFLIMNYAVYIGFLRYIKGTQSVLWEKAKREL